jgi:hypothetical protein
MIKGLTFYILFALTGIICGCSETAEPKPYVYSKVFTGNVSKTWRIDRLIFREKGQQDEILGLSNCEKDDLYTFYANDEKLFEVDNGNLACSEDNGGGILVSYIWEFNQANASLSMVTPHIFGNFFIPFTVKDANEKDMELEIFLDENATISYVLFFKLVDQE